MADKKDARNINPFYYSIGTRVRDKVFARMLGDVRGRTLLDIGCGLGYFTDFFQNKGATCTGIDLDERCLRYCTQSMGGTYLSWDITSYPYPFPDNHFDFIICSEVLEHVRDNGKVLAEIRRLLRPNGILIASTPCSEGVFGSFIKNIGHRSVDSHSLEYHWHKGFTREELSTLLAKHGIVAVDAQYTMVFVVEIVMGLTKLFVGHNQGKDIDSQADALNMTRKPFWEVYRKLFPILAILGNIEQPLDRLLRGHMIIVKGVKT